MTPLTAMLDGRFNRKKRVSSSARAPPRECPTWIKRGQRQLPKEKTQEKLTAITEVAPLELIKPLTSPRTVFAVALCASLNP